MEIERCQDGEEFWRIFEQSLRRVGFLENSDWTDDEALKIPVKYTGSKPWILHAPLGVSSDREWQRIAECFRPIYAKAMVKWLR